jgi:hypothetical protein
MWKHGHMKQKKSQVQEGRCNNPTTQQAPKSSIKKIMLQAISS